MANKYLTNGGETTKTIAKGAMTEIGQIGSFVVMMAPAIAGGLSAKQIYTWGIKLFKNEKRTSVLFKTDEGAGSLMVLIFSYLVWRLIPLDMAQVFIAGLIGRSSYVIRNTFWYRMMGTQPPAAANSPIQPFEVQPAPAERTQVAGNGPSDDDGVVREIGQYGLENTDFREKIGNGFAQRMNAWLDSQGRPPIEADAIKSATRDIFASMAQS